MVENQPEPNTPFRRQLTTMLTNVNKKLVERGCTVPAEADERALERRRRTLDAPARLSRLGILREHQAATLDDFAPSAVAVVRAFLEHATDWRGLLLHGTVGTGKTHLAAAIARVLVIDQDNPVKLEFTLSSALIMRLWETFRDGSQESAEAVVRRYSALPWLIIDDLGNEGRASDMVRTALHRILTIRNGDFRPTIVTTNLVLPVIEDRYGAPIASRIGAWESIKLTGADRRRA